MKNRNFSHGTPEQFAKAIRTKIQELDPNSSEIDSCDAVTTANDPYSHSQVWSSVKTSLSHNGFECDVKPNKDFLTVYVGSSEYTVPYDDLHLDAEHLDEDVDYIVGEICKMENAEGQYLSSAEILSYFDPIEDMDAVDTIGQLNKGDRFKNRLGTVITITDPAKDGRIQYCVGDECRIGSERSIQLMLYRNNYQRI